MPVGFDCTKIRATRHRQARELPGRRDHDRLRRSRGRFRFFCGLLSAYHAGRQKIARAAVWRRGCQPDHRHGDPPEHYPVGDIHLRLTRITPTGLSSPTTTHEAATPVPSTSPAHRCSTDGGATFTRVTTASGQSPFCQYRGRPCSSVQQRQPPPGSPSGSTRPAAVRASADTSPPIPRTRLAGPISAFTAARSDDRESGWADNNPSSPFCEPDVHFLERLQLSAAELSFVTLLQ